MEKLLEYPYGKAYCYSTYVYFERKVGSELSCDEIKILLQNIHDYYGKQKFVYISYRKVSYTVDPKIYKFIDNKQMLGIAIVSENLDTEKDLLKEQELFGGAFALFKSLDQAISWVETFDFS